MAKKDEDEELTARQKAAAERAKRAAEGARKAREAAYKAGETQRQSAARSRAEHDKLLANHMRQLAKGGAGSGFIATENQKLLAKQGGGHMGAAYRRKLAAEEAKGK